jgi:ribosomal protein S18 acetylase RimI-like enzyme
VQLRPARIDEKHELARLFQRARDGWDFVPRVPDHVLPRIADDLFARHEEVWVAEEDGRLLGFVAIRRSRRNGWEVVEKIYVDPVAQNRGIGSALLDQAKALRPDGLVLWVFQENTGARRFYERHGFRVVTLRFGAAADNMEGEPDALYAWPGVSPERTPAASGRGSTAR